ncbi:hypothetical protein DPMN_097108 [Dreissena polymorpha]|uniref:Uncharacterized protein n=1 Tax=Dreissena polymorpha TaxID=45954 RepID=A0A9D4R625_DREPO|nr:hypothetical protein DPMN_097108 [Dreissena polymorpha]
MRERESTMTRMRQYDTNSRVMSLASGSRDISVYKTLLYWEQSVRSSYNDSVKGPGT